MMTWTMKLAQKEANFIMSCDRYSKLLSDTCLLIHIIYNAVIAQSKQSLITVP